MGVAPFVALAGDEGRAVPVLPSGLRPVLQEAILDVKPDGQLTYARYRFVAPGIVGDKAPDYQARQKDMDVLCNQYALPESTKLDTKVDRIVISIADRESEFGVANPDVTQFFEAFSVKNQTCIWEEF